jgi:methylated-DNA-[protein]-cysteine S-methyltransferase
MMIRTTVLETPIGPLALLAVDGDSLPHREDGFAGQGTLVAAGFTADPGELHARLHPSLRSYELERVDDLGEISKAHKAYFTGDLAALDSLTVYQPGSWRREALWTALRQVPAGHTLTYGQLAARAGLERAARAAGQACAQNLIAPVVPCHRVLPASGPKKFGGYYYGTDRKEWLLRHEAAHQLDPKR